MSDVKRRCLTDLRLYIKFSVQLITSDIGNYSRLVLNTVKLTRVLGLWYYEARFEWHTKS